MDLLLMEESERSTQWFACESNEAIDGGGESVVSPPTGPGDETGERLEAMAEAELEQMRRFQQAKTQHSLAGVSLSLSILDTAHAVRMHDNDRYVLHTQPAASHRVLGGALVDRVDDRRGNAAFHPVVGEKLNLESLP